jgi:hypothetical protein
MKTITTTGDLLRYCLRDISEVPEQDLQVVDMALVWRLVNDQRNSIIQLTDDGAARYQAVCNLQRILATTH